MGTNRKRKRFNYEYVSSREKSDPNTISKNLQKNYLNTISKSFPQIIRTLLIVAIREELLLQFKFKKKVNCHSVLPIIIILET